MTLSENKEKRFAEINFRNNKKREMVLEGYALKFNSPAVHRFGSTTISEIISEKALENTNMDNVPLRYNHTDNIPVLASTRNGSLKLVIDEIGLKIIATLSNTNMNKDWFRMVQDKLITKMSFAFTIDRDGELWEEKEGFVLRTIAKIDKLYDVSLVDTPYYETTEIDALEERCLSKFKKSKNELLELKKKKIKLKLKYGGF
jgi:HK97 family phage prohead protease